ncbi:MAG: gluconate 2-dehydrogenase subunit 3 family protein [Thaumarchaeota archaeon]|nr:gluconate 2-dehydrogenase subunit 3 family protein [Nitrososphaerota archaeon]MCL5318227.1 gluconate 2-dehydrogenase subunit 3 family protein [Nitrososphaerota archaeon]
MSSSSKSRRDFIKIGAAAVGGAAVASAVEIPLLTSQTQQKDNELQQKNTQLQQKDQQISQLQGQVSDASRMTGFLTLNPKERPVVEAMAETMIPSDAETGAGAKEAGVIFFIDRQLAGSYGKNGNMYMQGPFIQPGLAGPVTVGSVTYPKGSPSVRIIAGTRYQHAFSLREYWRRGIQFTQDYSNKAYGGNFEKLSADKQVQVLQDMFDNKPTNFTGPTAAEFVSEVHDMVMGGYFADPLYGGNRGLVSWKMAGFNGTNMGEEVGKTTLELARMSSNVRLTPKSLADLQGGK